MNEEWFHIYVFIIVEIEKKKFLFYENKILNVLFITFAGTIY
jgi:hypothetical protein